MGVGSPGRGEWVPVPPLPVQLDKVGLHNHHQGSLNLLVGQACGMRPMLGRAGLLQAKTNTGRAPTHHAPSAGHEQLAAGGRL